MRLTTNLLTNETIGDGKQRADSVGLPYSFQALTTESWCEPSVAVPLAAIINWGK